MSHILIFFWDHLILYEIMYISWPEPCFMLFSLRKAAVFLCFARNRQGLQSSRGCVSFGSKVDSASLDGVPSLRWLLHLRWCWLRASGTRLVVLVCRTMRPCHAFYLRGFGGRFWIARSRACRQRRPWTHWVSCVCFCTSWGFDIPRREASRASWCC